ncbi:FUCL7-like protein, partial [Mya arenaria]
ARNVALGKPAYQTDTFSQDTTADKAVDGNTSGNLLYDKSCTHTLSSDATWSVDLGAIYQVSTVTIYNRNAVRLRNVEVFIGLDKDGPYSLAGFHEGVVGASYTFTMPPNSQARYVNITRNPPYQRLTLCEVEVESPSSKFATSSMAKIQNSTPLATISNVRSPIGCAYACHMDLKCLKIGGQFQEQTNT